MFISILAAAGVGAAFAWKTGRGARVIPVADATVTENLNPLSKQEQTLRDASEQYLNPPKGKPATQAGGFGVCADLGLFYLDNDRLDDAGKLFERLEQNKQPRDYRMLGRLGLGIILALRDQPKQSNSYFRQVFSLSSGKGGKGKKGDKLSRRLEEHVGQSASLLKNPRWRYWIARARWYNAENGLRDEQVPFLLRRIPLREGADLRQPGGDKGFRPKK
jgi:hypothetical protein